MPAATIQACGRCNETWVQTLGQCLQKPTAQMTCPRCGALAWCGEAGRPLLRRSPDGPPAAAEPLDLLRDKMGDPAAATLPIERAL